MAQSLPQESVPSGHVIGVPAQHETKPQLVAPRQLSLQLAAPEHATVSQLFASRQSIAQLPPEQAAVQLFASRQSIAQLA